jgi:hypothetical protein
MEDLIKRCKETNGQLSEIQKQMYEMVKELVKRYQEETGEPFVEFERDGRPLYSNNETGLLECYYRAKVADDKLLMTKDDGSEKFNVYNEDWRYGDAVDLDQVYACIINKVEIDYLFYLENIKDELYWELPDEIEAEDQ